jgi:hypothetical protein
MRPNLNGKLTVQVWSICQFLLKALTQVGLANDEDFISIIICQLPLQTLTRAAFSGELSMGKVGCNNIGQEPIGRFAQPIVARHHQFSIKQQWIGENASVWLLTRIGSAKLLQQGNWPLGIWFEAEFN